MQKICGNQPQAHPTMLPLEGSCPSRSVDMAVIALPNPVLLHDIKKFRDYLFPINRRVVKE